MKTSLQKRTIIFLVCVFAIVGILISALVQFIMIGGINELENQYVNEHIVSAENAIQKQLTQLNQVVRDWAPWDDSYEYIMNHSQAYEENNLNINSIMNLDLDMMVFIDQTGEFVFAKVIDKNNKKLIPIYTDLRENLKKTGLLTNADPKGFTSGIMMLAEGPMLFASYPIIRSDYSGPVRGNLIVGRLLDMEVVKAISKDLNLQVSVDPVNGKNSAKFIGISAAEPVRIDRNNENLIMGYTVIKDIFQQPSIGLIVGMDLDFSAVGREAVTYLGAFLAIIGILLMLLISIFLDKNILLRLKKLSKNVCEIGQKNSTISRLPAELMDDEISIVSDSINGMLNKLETSRIELEISEEKYRTFVEKGRDIVFAVDISGMITYISPNCEEIIGLTDREITGGPFLNILHPHSQDSWRKILQQARERRQDINDFEFLGKSIGGEWQWYRTDVAVLTDENKCGFLMGIFYNINEKKLAETALIEAHAGLEKEVQFRTRQLVETNAELANEIELRKLAQEKIERLAYYDHLTGLPNRLLLMDRLQQAIDLAKRIEKPISIMYMDLDGFKTVNDTMGHDHGDELLKVVATRLGKLVRQSDTVARMGGDEFIIMAQNLGDTDQIQTVVDKIVDAFIQPFELNNQEVYITVSVGISVYPADGETVGELVKNADLAMYKAKEGGKNQYIYCTRIMKEVIEGNMKLSNGLYRALERKELEVYYQPQVCYSTQKIVGLEALLRWNHPEMGLVLPGKFIHLAEQTGLIIPIGEWVLRDVCRQNKIWQEAGLPPVRIAVNLSIIQFQSPNIVSQIKGILTETNLSPEYLELEITESIAMRDTDFIINVLKEFQELGVYISIDDFGTEFSSLKYLKMLPINRIKIPMPFIQGIDIDEKDEAITKTIIVLARNMGMDVIAEGVETKQQEAFLTQRMCDEMQGFYYYKPMPAKEIETIMRGN